MKKKIFITCSAAFITIYTVPSTVLAATPKNYIFEAKDRVSEQSALHNSSTLLYFCNIYVGAVHLTAEPLPLSILPLHCTLLILLTILVRINVSKLQKSFVFLLFYNMLSPY